MMVSILRFAPTVPGHLAPTVTSPQGASAARTAISLQVHPLTLRLSTSVFIIGTNGVQSRSLASEMDHRRTAGLAVDVIILPTALEACPQLFNHGFPGVGGTGPVRAL